MRRNIKNNGASTFIMFGTDSSNAAVITDDKFIFILNYKPLF